MRVPAARDAWLAGLLAALAGCTGPSEVAPSAEAPSPPSSAPPTSATLWKAPPPPAPLAAHPPIPAGPARSADWTASGDVPCGSCHAEEAAAWARSHHAQADTPPLPAEDTPRFTGAAVQAGNVHVTPHKQGAGFAMKVVDAGGTRDATVVGRIGVAPLQQYLLAGAGGRVLVSPIAWDVEKGRWFDPSVSGAVGDPQDPFYWAGITGTWNHMCASCHTTGFDEGFDPAKRTYASTWTAADIGCVDCHGADASVDARTAAGQMQACGYCHSRRDEVAHGHPPGGPLYDEIAPTLLDGPVYSADGAIQAPEEAFEYTSFALSRMGEAGVRCTDCHDPHSGSLRAEGAAVCDSCHAPETFATATHSGHAPGGPDCIDCHMGTATYMGVHVRHDHHFRVPDRATLQAAGRPGPCAACHADGRLPPEPTRPSTHTLLERELTGLYATARRSVGAPHPDNALLGALAKAALNPSLGEIRRGSAILLLGRLSPGVLPQAAGPLGQDLSPTVRLALAESLAATGQGAGTLGALLRDPMRTVRLAALRGVPPGSPDASRVLEEFAALARRSDVGADHANLGVLYGMGGQMQEAEGALRTAVAIDPTFTPARQNLAVILAQTGRKAEGERVLKGDK